MADTKQKKADGKDKKDKKGKRDKGQDAGAGRPSVADHPRARASVRRMKGLGGLAGFAVGAFLAHGAGLSTTSVIERALICGMGSYLLAWACAVAVWRQIVRAELRMIFDLHQAHVRSLSGGAPTADPAGPAAASTPTGGS